MKSVEVLKAIVEDVYPVLKKISSAQLSDKPADEKWSSKEIIGHLIDSAINNHRRLILSENKDDLLFEGYDQVLWVKRNNYQNRAKLELLDLWRLSNIHFADAATSLPVSKLNAMTTDHSFYGWSMIPFEEGKPASLNYLIEDYVYHLEHHILQIIPEYKRRVSYSMEGYKL